MGGQSAYRHAQVSLLVRVFDPGLPPQQLDEMWVAHQYRSPRIWGPAEWPRGTRSCVVDGAWGWTMRDVLRGGAVDPATAVRLVADLCVARRYIVSHPLGASAPAIDPATLLVGADGVTRSPAPLFWPRTISRGAGHKPAEPYFAWLAPERVRGQMAGSQTTLVWELGAVLFTLLTGSKALGASWFEALQRNLKSDKPRIDSVRPGEAFPPGLVEIVDLAGRLDSSERIQSLSDFAARLDEEARHLGPGRQPEELFGTPPRPAPFLRTTGDSQLPAAARR